MSILARNYHEKRHFLRMQMASPATLILDDGSSHYLTCIDLSSSGAQLNHNQPLPIGQTGLLRINSSGNKIANLEARVCVQRIQEVENNQFSIGLLIEEYL